jgi:peptidoglycan DL-endopeptidase LytE
MFSRNLLWFYFYKGKAMNRKRRTAIIFATIAFLLGSICGYAKDKPVPPKHKRAARVKTSSVYVVRQGDTLSKIASTHKTTVEALKSANNLKNNRLKVGLELKIPSSVKNATLLAESKTPKALKKQQAAAPKPIPVQIADQPENSENQPLRYRVVQAGFQFLGVRYHRSGESAKNGFDCSGLVKTLFSKFNIDLPRTSREQYQQGEKIDRNELEIGDLVFFSSKGNNPTHVGIYVGDNKFMHAALKAKQVIVSDLSKIWYSMRYLGARRVIWGDEPETPEPQDNQDNK